MRVRVQNVKPDYNQLRADLVSRGLNISSWARMKGYRASSVYSAARGERTGRKSLRIVKELLNHE